MSKEITIEDLAMMVNKGFEKVDERFDKVDERLNSIDMRLARVETDVSEIRKTYIDPEQFEDLMIRVKYIEIKLGIESGK